MQKENYDLKFKEIISALDYKPSILLQVCCAPCSSYVLDLLKSYFKITVLFYNPNIYPLEEYLKRKEELIKLLKIMQEDIEILDVDYENESFNENIKGLEEIREGGIRCEKCIDMRLNKTGALAKNKGFDYFGTTLSVSPHKNANYINKCGSLLEKKYEVNFLYADFKKNNGFKISISKSKEYDLYRQEYCGCKYSIRN